MVDRIYPRFRQFGWFYFEFSLFLEGNFLSSDRSGRCDYFWFYVAQSKSALKMPFRMIKIPSRNILIDENLLTDQLPFVFQGHKCRFQLSPSQIQPPPSLVSHFHILAFRRNYLAICVQSFGSQMFGFAITKTL